MLKSKNTKSILKLPFGFRDIFPIEASERKRIEDVIRHEFEAWGYGEVKTPVFEFTENISLGVGNNWKNKLMSFFDIDGSLISLRADMTIPIARLVGMRIKREQLPIRFYYIANSFRQSHFQKGKKRVLNQAGLELIGVSELAGDIEVLTILTNILKNLKIFNFKIALSHTDFLNGMAEWFNLRNISMDFIKTKMIEKNFVELREFLSLKDKYKTDIFFNLIEPSEDFEKIDYFLDKIENKNIFESLKYLIQVFKILKNLGLSEQFILDLSVRRDFEYYKGLLFEVYSTKVSEIIGSGGRYDGLINKFGLDVAGTGFALDTDLLHQSVDKISLNDSIRLKRVILMSNLVNIDELIKISQKIRKKGFIVEISFTKHDFEIVKNNLDIIKESTQNLYEPDFIYFIDFKESKLNIIDIKKKILEVVSINEL